MELLVLGTMLAIVLIPAEISLPLRKTANSLPWAHNPTHAVTGTPTIEVSFTGVLIVG